MITVSSDDLPGSYVEASRVSRDAQKKYFKRVRAELSLIVLAALASVVGFAEQGLLTKIEAVLIIASVIATCEVWKSRWAKVWFEARAVAESVKTLAWRYMTRADPFGTSLSLKEADTRFVDAVKKVLNERQYVIEEMIQPSGSTEITPKMREVRGLSLFDRRDVYLECRLKDQQDWYSRQAVYNRTAKRRLYVLIIAVQVLSCVSALAHAEYPQVPIDFAGFLLTLAAALLTWLQAKRHEELSQSYAVVAKELMAVYSLVEHVDSEETLSRFVTEVEGAISREHTLWVARRTYCDGLQTN